MDLLALADFNLVARHGGFGRAARAAGRPKATLSRRVAELEAALATRLFERGTRDLKLTEEGRTLHQRTSALLTEIDESAAEVASGGQRPSGKLRISAPMLFSQTAMGGIAAGFAANHPDVRLEITTDDRQVDMVEEGYDLVIRVNPRPDDTLVGRAFARDRQVIVAAPRVRCPADGQPVAAVVHGASDATGWQLADATGQSVIAIDPIMSLSSMIMVRDAVLQGAGAGCVPLSLVSGDLAAGRLVRWADAAGPETALWALYPSRRLLSARVSAFLSYLKFIFPTGSPEELAALVR